MLFDLEIQPNTISLQFVNAGDTISTSQVPGLYLNTKESNIVPGDFVSIDTGSSLDRLLNLNIKQVNLSGYTFEVESNQILVTHIAKYSKLTATKYPIFFKHVITLENGATLLDQSIRIYNESGNIIDSELYVIESGINNETYIYINPSQNTLLIAEWADSNTVHRECLKLQPIFEDKGSSFSGSNSDLTLFGFYITHTNNKFICHVARQGSIFYTSKKDYTFVQKPVGNLNEPWYLLFNNISIRTADTVYYRLPEYDIQRYEDAQIVSGYNTFYKKYTNQLAKILNNKFIQLQMKPALTKLDDVNIYIYETITKSLTAAYTTNSSIVGTPSPVSSILWNKIDDYSYDGIFILNRIFDSNTYSAYADYSIDNIYYEFRYLDLNSIPISRSKLISLYISPSVSLVDNYDTASLFYVFIGTDDGKTYTQKYQKNAVSFVSIADYQSFISNKNCFHLAYISVETDKMNDILELTYCANNKEIIFNQNDISKNNLDLVYDKLLNNKFSLQMNDVAVSYIDNSVLETEDNQLSINNNNEYIDFVNKVVNENITISTKNIIGKNIISSFV